ncbi:MAG: S-methyl-5'-thioadenosine phosphorylase [Thermodesulfovibrionales bacterium]
MPEFGIIGGSGLYRIPGLEILEEMTVSTPYGEPSGRFTIGRLSGKEIAFLPRHGAGHTLQPHRINYRANIRGFKQLGVKRLLSVFATGGIRPDLAPGSIVVPDQIIDSTSNRASTFFDQDEVVHIDFTEPFCPVLRTVLGRAAKRAGIVLLNKGTYLCVNGPRLETAAEIRAYALLGADIVGMTAMPEAALAREAGICYAGLSVVTNHAAGISEKKLTVTEVKEVMGSSEERLRSILKEFFMLRFKVPACSCRQTLESSRM